MYEYLLKWLLYNKCSISPIHVPLPVEHHQKIPIAFPHFSLKGAGLAFEVHQEEKKKRKKRQEEGRFQNQMNISHPMFWGFQDKVLV